VISRRQFLGQSLAAAAPAVLLRPRRPPKFHPAVTVTVAAGSTVTGVVAAVDPMVDEMTDAIS
jgi:hypothetical protein